MRWSSLPRRRVPLLAACAFLPALGLAAACSKAFAPASVVNSVRVLAVQASKPYANPGDAVTLTALAVDGRATQTPPMTLYWVPEICPNPPGGAFYGCYSALSPGLRPGADITSLLRTGTTFGFSVPADILTSRAQTQGNYTFGEVFAFFIACTGKVLYTPPSASGPPDANPLECVDARTGAPVPADDYVFGYAEVFSFAPVDVGGVATPITNTNPVITGLTLDGTPVDPDAGIVMPVCNSGSCTSETLDTVVPPSSQEVNQDTIAANGNVGKEQIWVDYYLTVGSIANATIVLYDPFSGAERNTGTALTGPSSATEGSLWAVVRDDRGGVSWVSVPVVAR